MSDAFDWDEGNISHIAEHDIVPSEAEEVVTHSPLDLGYELRGGEMRLRQAGETAAGRVLAVVTVLRRGRTRVVTAYPASRSLRRIYAEYKELVDDGRSNPA